jgi:GNAT superfamily N-acetyltransferase
MGQDAGCAAVIRRLAPDDWPVLREVRLAALADAPYAFSSTLNRELSFDEQIWRERLASAAWFMAWQDSQPAGLAAGIVEQPAGPPGSAGTSVPAGGADPLAAACQLVSMWVSPRARGHGIADRLVEAVCDWARAGGAAQVLLWVTDVNARARAFYQRAGFVTTGVRGLVRPQEPDNWEEQMSRLS